MGSVRVNYVSVCVCVFGYMLVGIYSDWFKSETSRYIDHISRDTAAEVLMVYASKMTMSDLHVIFAHCSKYILL